MSRLIPRFIDEIDFVNGLSALTEYYEKFGSLSNIKPTDMYQYKGGLIYIGAFVNMIKIRYERGLLDKIIAESLINMGLEMYDRLAPLRAYYEEFGTIANIRTSEVYKYQSKEISIGRFIANIRRPERKSKLTQEEINELESMGMIWKAYDFNDRIAPLRAYYEEFGTITHIKISDIYKYQGKVIRIGTLISKLRTDYRECKLTQEEINELESMGMLWKVFDFNDRIAPLRAYYEEFGTIFHIKISDIYKYQGKDVRIGKLIHHLRTEYKKCKLTKEEIELLNSMEMLWDARLMQGNRSKYKENIDNNLNHLKI